MATMEALAAGLPVIASDHVMSALQYIEPGVNGWIFQVGDLKALASIMQNVVDNKQKWPEWSKAARASLSRYDPDVDAARLAGFLEQVHSQAVTVP
jgi:glycosyltransferase involved in cell wall biosynthesis